MFRSPSVHCTIFIQGVETKVEGKKAERKKNGKINYGNVDLHSYNDKIMGGGIGHLKTKYIINVWYDRRKMQGWLYLSV